MATVVAAMSGVPFDMIVAGTTGSGTIVAPPPSFRNHTFLIKGSSGVGAGAIQIESSNDPADAGTWAPVGSGPITVVASSKLLAQFSGIFSFLRARISTTVTGGGSLTATYVGQL